MENFLLKLARQLDTIDEASLMALWDKYAAIVSRFEPSKRWEEAVLVFSLIQAKRWKNQLFNYHWAEQAKPGSIQAVSREYDAGFSLESEEKETSSKKGRQKGKILNFVMPEKKPEIKKEETEED